MLRFSGPAGSLYRVGEPLRFTAPLEDCGDGFDWRAADPSLRYWLEASDFAVWRGGDWTPLRPLEVWPASGRVGFDHCYRDEHLRVSGACLPLSLVCETGPWEGELHSEIKRNNTLGSHSVEAVPGERIARFPELLEPLAGRVLARLRGWEPNYLFVGTGDSIRSTRSGTVLTFDEKGLVYVPC